MTARLLVVGNSHVAAIRAALEEAPERQGGVQVEVLALRASMLGAFDLREGRLLPATDEARARFETLNPDPPPPTPLADYAAIAVVGLDFKPLTAMAFWRGARWPGLPSLHEVEDLATMAPLLVSRAAAEAAVASRLAGCAAARLIRLIRPQTEAPVFLLPCPRLSQRGKWTDVPRFHGHGRAVDGGDGGELDALWEGAAARVGEALAVRYLPQPRNTIVGGIMTKRRFMRDDVVTLSTAAGHRQVTDMVHGNAAYGAAVLGRLVAQVTGPAA